METIKSQRTLVENIVQSSVGMLNGNYDRCRTRKTRYSKIHPSSNGFRACLFNSKYTEHAF